MRQLKEVTIEMIQRCNSLCIFCSSNSHTFAQNEIPLEKILEICQFIKTMGAHNVNLSGGEPLLRKDIAEIVKTIYEMGLKSTIYTSGNIVDKEVIEAILEKQIPPDKLAFIFNYPSCDNNIYQRLINNHKMNIFNLNAYIKAIIEKGFPVEAHIVPNAINIETLYTTISHLKQLSVKKVSLLRIVYQGRAQLNKASLYLTEAHTGKLRKIIQEVQENLCDAAFSLRVGIPFKTLVRQKYECMAGFAKLIFRYDGVVFPCEAFKEAPGNVDYILGNIYKDSFEQIWENHPVHHKLSLLKKAAYDRSEDCPAQILYTAKE